MHQKKQLNFEEILKLINSPLKAGSTWYLLDTKWFDMCKNYHDSGDKSVFPGPIDNSALFQPIPASCNEASNGFVNSNVADSTTDNDEENTSPIADAVSVDSRPLREDLNEAEGQFKVVPEKCWNLLKDTFGIVNANHAIKRRVIEFAPGELVVEIKPVKLKLCLYGGKEATVEKYFSRVTTLDELQQEMRKVFNISLERETKLWINSEVFTFKPAVLSPSKSENSLQTSSPIKPPPTPPPMPTPNSSTSTASPNVVTRQAANSMNKAIALPDSSSSPANRSSTLSTSTSDSPISTASSSKESSPNQTLIAVGVLESAVVTLEVENLDGTWPSSRPRYGTVSTRSSKAQPGLCGLSNMGNTCFMNSALQCLSNTPPLTNYILTDKYVEDINLNNPLGMHGEIARTYAELIKVMWSGNNTSFLPREFKCAVSRFAPQFNGFAQQDCQELMAFLLDGLHEDLNRIRNKPYIELKNEIECRPDEVVAEESWANYKKRNDSIVVDTFHGLLKSTLVCPGCKLVSVTFDPFCYLSLPLPVKREKQVTLTFLPAPSKVDETKLKRVFSQLDADEIKTIKQYGGSITSFDGSIEEHGGYANQFNRPMSCKMQVPRSGPVSEICDIVARVINEERPSQVKKVEADNLVVAEIDSSHKISKVYESNEHYNQISDIIVVVEKGSNYLIPLRLGERKFELSYTRQLFLHVPDLRYETLYKSVIASLSNLTDKEFEKEEGRVTNWCKIGAPKKKSESESNAATDSVPMDCEENENGDEERGEGGGATDSIAVADSTGDGGENMDTTLGGSKTNGTSNHKDQAVESNRQAFVLHVVNSFGNYILETLNPNGKEYDYSSKLYLLASFPKSIATSSQFEHTHVEAYCPPDSFTPKVSPKPTLQLKDCITQFTNVERLGADDPWYCPKCKKHQQATKKFDIWSLPKVLIIHLKRFSFSRSWRDKIDTLVEFPVDNLDVAKYVLNPAQREKGHLIYNLIGVANHFGGLGGGHYTAFAKNAHQNAWYSFDDALVTQTTSSNVVTRSAYVLFYQLQEESQTQ